ncbi:MAG TPA: right-handed parallel beta-helix repeat-containing protein [Flavobacteriales bacterium]|nr:right-handed parallel beta-helix repeat-containing protein [Flavobacteriales bacterium]
MIRSLVLLCSFAATCASQAQIVRYVTSLLYEGQGTLHDVVQQAESGDTIRFEVTGVIFVGDGGITSLYKDLVIEGPGTDLLAIDGNGVSAPFMIVGGSTLMRGMTIRNGSRPSNSSAGGGGLYFNGDTLTLVDVHVTRCSTTSYNSPGGGGIHASGDAVRMIECLVDSNYFQGLAHAKGGGLLINSAAYELIDCTIQGNQISAQSSGTAQAKASGGGAYLEGSGTINGCVINGNIAAASGDFIPNSPGGATAQAGALYLYGYPAGEVTILNSTISDNQSRTGGNGDRAWEAGAIYSFGGDLTITGSTISRNKLVAPEPDVHDTRGGAIFVTYSGNLRLSNCVLDSNVARIGSAIFWNGLFTPTGGFSGALDLQRTRISHGMGRTDEFAVSAERASRVTLREVEFSENSDGGLFFQLSDTLLAERCLFTGNAQGALVNAFSSEATSIVNSTFDHNTIGGGLTVQGGTLDLRNCTFVDDSLASGAPSGRELSSYSCQLILRNNLFAETHSHGISAYLDVGGSTVISEGGNVCGDGSFGAALDQTNDATDTEAGLDTFGDHGGPTRTWSLLPTSTCIDRDAEGTLTMDQRGLARDANVDAGAFEFGGLDPTISLMDQSSDTVVCMGNELVLHVNAASAVALTFQWSHNDVVIPDAQSELLPLTASLNAAGTYICTITNGIQTVESAAMEVGVDVCAGIPAHSGSTWRLYPNPSDADRGVNICSEVNVGRMRIRLIDVQGRPVTGPLTIEGPCGHLPLTGVGPGMYAVGVEMNGTERWRGVVVQ